MNESFIYLFYYNDVLIKYFIILLVCVSGYYGINSSLQCSFFLFGMNCMLNCYCFENDCDCVYGCLINV